MRLLAVLAAIVLMAAPATAQVPDLRELIPAGDASVSGRIIQYIALLTVLSVAPGLLIMVTSFTRFAIALSFLRLGLGPAEHAGQSRTRIAGFVPSFFVMAPVFEKANTEGLSPYMEGKISDAEAYQRITHPFRTFMERNVREKDLVLFRDIAKQRNINIAEGDARDLRILVPAFMVSELRRGFEIGFLIALPFLVIDLIVSMLTMSMGMMMLPPTVISLPFKVLFFVLIDGWNLLAGSLVL